MARCKIVLADNDLAYLAPLELELLREFGDSLDVRLITDTEYLHNFFATPQKIDIMIINETLWDNGYRRQDIRQVFLLKEEEQTKNDFLYEYLQIYKYTSVQNVLKNVEGVIRRCMGENQATDCKYITVYSPQGGCGKTSLALGLAAGLSSLGGKVLYVDAETMQDFGAFLGIQSWMGDDLLREMKSGQVSAACIQRNLWQGSFDCLLPLRHALVNCGLTEADYQSVFQCIRAERLYEYLVVDTSSSFDADKAALLAASDHVVVPVLQNRSGRDKLAALAWNLDTSDTEKFVFVRNVYRNDAEDLLPDSKNDAPLTETIPWLPPETMGNLTAMRKSGCYIGLAYRFL